jgi:hypothetical protein
VPPRGGVGEETTVSELNLLKANQGANVLKEPPRGKDVRLTDLKVFQYYALAYEDVSLES